VECHKNYYHNSGKLSHRQGRAETSGGAGAQSIKWGTWKQGFT